MFQIKYYRLINIFILSLSCSCYSTKNAVINPADTDTVVYAPGNPYYHLSTCLELGMQRFNISVYAAKLKGLVPCPLCILGYSKQQFANEAKNEFQIKPIDDSETVYISPSNKSLFHRENCIELVNGKAGLAYSLAKARNLKPCERCFPKELIANIRKTTPEINSFSNQSSADRLILLAFLSAILSNKANYNNGILNSRVLSNEFSPFMVTGAIIIGGDGEYLGEITSQFNQNSIFNELGNYGSSFSSTSIWNNYSRYGSEFSNLSAFNTLATNPPKIFHNSIFIGYLTNNSIYINRITPYSLRKK